MQRFPALTAHMLPSGGFGLAAQSLPDREASRPTKNPAFAGFFESGRPDLNRGPHRPELWAKSRGVVRSTCKSMGSHIASAPARSSVIAVDSPGFGREIDSLPNDADTDAGSLVISPTPAPSSSPSPLRGHRAGGAPGAEQACDDTTTPATRPRRGVRPPLPHVDARAFATSRMTLASGRGARATRAWRRAPARASNAARSRGTAGLAVRVGVALAVARLGVGVAAAAHAEVPCLDRPRLLAGRV